MYPGKLFIASADYIPGYKLLWGCSFQALFSCILNKNRQKNALQNHVMLKIDKTTSQ